MKWDVWSPDRNGLPSPSHMKPTQCIELTCPKCHGYVVIPVAPDDRSDKVENGYLLRENEFLRETLRQRDAIINKLCGNKPPEDAE